LRFVTVVPLSSSVMVVSRPTSGQAAGRW